MAVAAQWNEALWAAAATLEASILRMVPNTLLVPRSVPSAGSPPSARAMMLLILGMVAERYDMPVPQGAWSQSGFAAILCLNSSVYCRKGEGRLSYTSIYGQVQFGHSKMFSKSNIPTAYKTRKTPGHQI